MKRTLLVAALAALVMGVFAENKTFAPTLDVNFRTAKDNTAWQTVKNAADEGNNDFELTYAAGFFSLQKFQVENLANVSKCSVVISLKIFYTRGFKISNYSL